MCSTNWREGRKNFPGNSPGSSGNSRNPRKSGERGGIREIGKIQKIELKSVVSSQSPARVELKFRKTHAKRERIEQKNGGRDPVATDCELAGEPGKPGNLKMHDSQNASLS